MRQSSKIRVALLATSVNFGGIERVLLTMLQSIDDGVEFVPVLFTRTDIKETSFFDRLRETGVTFEVLYVNNVKPTLLANPLWNLWQALALFRKRRFDVIHSHGYRADTFGFVIAKLLRLPIVSTCHGFVRTDRRLKWYNALDVRLLRSFSRVIVVSAQMKDELVAHGVPAQKINVITNAVATAEPAHRDERRRMRATLLSNDDEFVFGYVGRLSEEKGVGYLIDAARLLVDRWPKVRILVVGDGSQRAPLQERAAKCGLGDRIMFAGFQSDTAPWYAAMDAFVLPSLTEGTPLAMLEAMAARVPVIATSVGGVPTVISSGQHGILVPPADAESLARAMQDILVDAPLRKLLADRAFQLVNEKFGADRWARQIVDAYRAVVGPIPA